MNRIKFGLKLFSSNIQLLDDAVNFIDRKIFDYIELMIVPSHLDISIFTEYKIPYIVHIFNENHGFDIGNENKMKYNLKIIRHCIKSADKLNAKYIILHAGTGSEEAAKNILSEITDKRIVIENMSFLGIHNEKCLGYDAESIVSLGNFGVCLDFGHAIKASVSFKKNYKDVIYEFLKLEPKIFHISDGDFSEKDCHLHIGKGGYDFKYFKSCINKNKSKFVTLETPRNDLNSLREDLENIKNLKSLWKV